MSDSFKSLSTQILKNIPFYTQLCMDRKFAQLIKDLLERILSKFVPFILHQQLPFSSLILRKYGPIEI